MGKGKKSLGSKIETVSGRSFVNFLYGTGNNAVVPLIPATFPRALAMADVFEFYRFTSIKMDCIPGAAAGAYALGYSNQTFDTAPTTVSGVIELPQAVWQVSDSSVYRAPLTLGRKELVDDSPLKWYKTIAGSPDDLFEVQGNFYFAFNGGPDLTFYTVCEWTVEFSQWNLAAQSPKYEQVPGTDLFKKVPPPPVVKAERSGTAVAKAPAAGLVTRE